ncbi:multidrug effflux MFS transporter [Aminobacter sp. J44]|uniref:multidrug effflux MFS transporter n=1 Tax=Aminobacter sp. J44 TaxID=935262 RepID=UPI001198F4A4|nr:multidrug effflux MFS transporter [Aminobacter sp. J44]TWG63620.1 DHA1 family bicyclomycin/chloramphenicol resistance-like MFS transporter [Aminobacter sp. J44]
MNIQSPKPPAQLMSERRVSLICALIVVLGPSSLVLFTPAMPELAVVFGVSESAVKMTLISYFIGFAITQLICGPVSDGLGRKPVILFFVTVYGLGSLASLFAPSIELLVAARFLQGIGASAGIAISRAIVRDLFTGETSARIMNTIGMIMGIAPALAPTFGGFILELFGWQAVFAVMLVLGVVVAVAVKLFLVETVGRDLSRIRPKALVHSYATLLKHSYFMSASMVMAGSMGAFFTLTTILPFVLMNRVGLSPTQFGIGMLAHSLSFFTGTIVVRSALKRFSASSLVPVGLASIALGCVLLAIGLRLAPPTYISVMGPIAFFVFGAAFIMPAMSTASLAAFPHMAGAASALAGFLQIGGGLAGGVAAVLIGDPVIALASVIPGMGLVAIISWLIWRRLPEPVFAKVLPRETARPAPPAA